MGDGLDCRDQIISSKRPNEVRRPFVRRRSVTETDDANARVVTLQPLRNDSGTAFGESLLDHEHIEGNGPKRRQHRMAAVCRDAHGKAGRREHACRDRLQVAVFEDE